MNKQTIDSNLVLYCLIQRKGPTDQAATYLLVRKNRSFTFPPTKFRPREDLYRALERPMEKDLGLLPATYFPEEELRMIPNAGRSPRYPGLTKKWGLYPVVVTLSEAGWKRLAKTTARTAWQTLDKIAATTKEPNVRVIAQTLLKDHAALQTDVPAAPSMDALASYWEWTQHSGVRLVRGTDIARILNAGDRAFNLRVADPYLAYQRQGFGFTWSFFTAKDKQDVHVHGIPAVEIYGVIRGRLMLWHKPMNQRGVCTWQSVILGPGDWAEVEPLNCHLACWLDPDGLGTVIKAAGSGELAGVGRLGVSGKTTCDWSDPEKDDEKARGKKRCSNYGHCQFPPEMQSKCLVHSAAN